MRPETEKQIVKAFSMLYEDTEMPLGELIEKLQQLNGNKTQGKINVKKSTMTCEQIIKIFQEHGPILRTKDILSFLGRSKYDDIRLQLKKLVKKERLKKVLIHPKLAEYTLLV